MKLKALAFALIGFASLVSFSAVQAAEPAPGAKKATKAPVKIDACAAVKKTGKSAEKFDRLHNEFLARGKQGPIGVLFLGDSITEGWGKAPEVWEKYYSKYQPANFGIGGDCTHHVIWRIENGELDGIKPKVVVLMLGTNNTSAHTAQEIIAADTKIVGMIRSKIPEAKVLVLAVFPRGPRKSADGKTTDDGVKKMEIIGEVNKGLAKLADGKSVFFLDFNAKFLGADGKIPNDIMPDQLHPNKAGYQIWAEAMQPTLEKLMK